MLKFIKTTSTCGGIVEFGLTANNTGSALNGGHIRKQGNRSFLEYTSKTGKKIESKLMSLKYGLLKYRPQYLKIYGACQQSMWC